MFHSFRSIGWLAFALTCLGPWRLARSDPAPSKPAFTYYVSGHVQFDEQKAEMTHLYYARRQGDDGPLLALLFSNLPLAASVVEDRRKLSDLARRGSFVGLYVAADESGDVQTTDLFYGDGSFSGPWQYEAAAGNTALKAGRVATDGELDFFGKPVAVDVSFILGPQVDETWRGADFYVPPRTELPRGQASGWMTNLGEKTDLSSALVISEIDLFGVTGERKLLLSASVITEEMLTTMTGPEAALQAAGVPFLRVGLDSNHEIGSIMVPDEAGNLMSFSSSQWQFELALQSAEALEGHVEWSGTKHGDVDSPRFAVSFNAAKRMIGATAAVTAKNGRPLPEDGGEPGQAYARMGEVLRRATSLEALAALRIPSLATMVREVASEQRAAVLAILKQQGEAPLNVVGGYSNENAATLWLAGVANGKPTEGRVNLHREAGIWKLGLEAFRTASTSER